MLDDDLQLDVATRHVSVFETRPKRRQAPRLSDGKDHPVVIRQLSLVELDEGAES
jgi:hypothetical protein